MSFSGQSNPPWQRNSLNNSMQGMGFHQNSQMFVNQQSNQGFNQMNSGNVNQMSGGQVFQQQQAVAYPTRSGLNPVAFQNNSGSGQNQQNNMNMHGGQNRQTYNGMGTVTKISNDCGLVNDEVLFYKNICKGVVPKVGDRVLFESTFSTTSQFKWNATRVQLVSQAGAQTNQAPPPPLMGNAKSSSGYNAVPPPVEYRALVASQRRGSPARRGSPDRHRDRKESNRARDRNDRSELESDRKRRREESPRPRDRERRDQDKRDVSLDKKDRDRSPVRRLSPKRRKARAIPRYVVQIPKTLLTFKSGGVQDIKRRYSNLYIPSDFFHTKVTWSDTFTPDNPFSIRRPCTFHIAHKMVEPLNGTKSVVEPDDVDYSFSAKVMLLGCPPLSELYQKSFNQDEHEDTHHCVHPSRLINFLVGTRARNEPMAIGGPWSPSLDGENPDKDPAVLIRTAIRNCKNLTGIDLSSCTQWYRFVELYYHRSDYTSKGKLIPSRVETVVIYLPDIHSCMPTRSEWEKLAVDYKIAATNHINRLKSGVHQSTSDAANAAPRVSSQDKKSTTQDADAPDSATSLANLGGEAGNTKHDENGTEKGIIKKEPTHYSKLEPKTMKIQELRDELEARNLLSKGLKPQVMARLVKALAAEKEKDVNTEKEEEKAIEDNEKEDEKTTKIDAASEDVEMKEEDNDADIEVDMSDIVILDEYDSSKNPDGENQEKDQVKELDEKERKQLERRYVLPEEPHVIVHPSKTAKDGKFDCTVMSLSVLLDYRPEDTKERFFEVSLFAELFNEMLIRDFGFTIYKELHFYKDPNAEKEEPKKDETKQNEDDEKSKDSSSQDHATTTDRKSLGENEKKEKNSRDRRVSKRPAEDDTEDENFSVHSMEKRKRSDKKMVVVKPNLLLSFVYFDTTHCGYIFEKDLEELFCILGLNLSRAEIRKFLSKAVSRHALYYRKLTDAEEKPENTIKDIDAEDEFPIEELKRIAMGNNSLIRSFDDVEERTVKSSSQSNNDGMALHNGVLVHVGKLFEQNKRYEKSYSELETLYSSIQKQYAELQTNYSKASNKAKDLQTEVKSLLRKLSDADQDLYTLNKKYNEQNSALTYCYDKLAPFVQKPEKAHKSNDGSRDRDASKDKKEDKEKDKKDEKEKKDDKEKKDEKEKKEKKDEKDKKDEKEKKEDEKEKKDDKTEDKEKSEKPHEKVEQEESSAEIVQCIDDD